MVLDFRSQVNILTKRTREKLGRPQLVKLDYYLKLADQGMIEPLGLCRNIQTTIMGISVKIDFKVIEPKEGSKSYSTLVDRPWERKMKANISLEKDRIRLKGQGKKIIIPLDPKEGAPWEELDDSEDKVRQLYKIIQRNLDSVDPIDQAELDIGSPTSIRRNFNADLYDVQLEKYESYAKDCWSVEAIPKHQVCIAKVHNCYSISIVLKVVVKKVREYPTLIPNNIANTKLRFKEIDLPVVQLNEVIKNIGDQGLLQSLVESFTDQATRWWGTHQNLLQSWMTTLMSFVERFGEQKLTAQAQITKFHLGDDLTKHIDLCQKEWKHLGYHDERTWPYLFPTMLDDLPNKWYKIEEARGDTFTWHTLRENLSNISPLHQTTKN